MKIILALLTLFWLIGSTYWYKNSCCSSCAKSETDVGVAHASIHMKKPVLSLIDADWSKNYDDHFKFKLNSDEPILNEKMTQSLADLAGHCKGAKPTRLTEIVGYYSNSEKNTSTFENLGVARAEKIKALLVESGLEAGNLFTTGSELKNNPIHWADEEFQYGGIDFNISQIKAEQKTELSEEVLLEPRMVYFETGRNSIIVTDELENYLLNAQAYLKKHPEVKLSVTGHTDNQGNKDLNLNLSKERAAYVKEQLAKKGMSDKQIVSDGKGDSQPLADNKSAEGRAQNRRVEIQILK